MQIILAISNKKLIFFKILKISKEGTKIVVINNLEIKIACRLYSDPVGYSQNYT
jgi:hypothetical protein